MERVVCYVSGVCTGAALLGAALSGHAEWSVLFVPAIGGIILCVVLEQEKK